MPKSNWKCALKALSHPFDGRFDVYAVERMEAFDLLFLYNCKGEENHRNVRERIASGNFYFVVFKLTPEHVVGPIALWTRVGEDWKLMSIEVMTW